MTEKQTTRRVSLADELELESPMDAAAAGSAVAAVSLMNDAAHASGIRQRTLAARVGVSEGRVSQVLNGDGNVRVSTLARFLRAAGYRLRLSAVPLKATTPRVESTHHGRVRQEVFMRTMTVPRITPDGVGEARVVQISDAPPGELVSGYGWSNPPTEVVPPRPARTRESDHPQETVDRGMRTDA